MISYFIYTIISLGCVYALYFLLLRKQKTFQFNRFFLLGSLMLCLLAPFIEIEMFSAIPRIVEIPVQTFTESTEVSQDIEAISFGDVELISQPQTSPILYIFLTVSLFLLFRFFKNLIKIYNITRAKYESFGKLKLIRNNDSDMISSFFNYVFIYEKQDLKNKDFLCIIKHETVHCQQLHSLDVIIVELLICLFWFNPFIWLYKKSILQNHEYIADEKSVSSGINIENYSNTIINLGQKEHRVPLTSGFNFIQIKNRINMLHQSKSSVLKRTLRITTVILLFAGIFVYSSCKEDIEDQLSDDPLVVVIDAGHGGKDPGQLSSNIKEKDIVLNISNILRSLSDDKLKIITTRDSDAFLSLEERITFINKQNPDIVVSLHCNANNNNAISGVEAYYYESENFERYSESMKFSSLLVSKLVGYAFDNAKIAPASYKILKEVECPSVLLELGFLSNENDKNILSNEVMQKEIAQVIYEGLLHADDFEY